MRKRLLKIVFIILVIILVREVVLVSITRYNNKKSVDAYFKNDTTFNYKSDFIIEIPKINLESVIKKADADFKNLDDSLVYYKYDNYKEKLIVFGHSGVGYGTYFNRLDELGTGDDVYLYKDRHKISYVVSKIYSVFDTELGVLNNDKKGVMLLITCEKSNKNKRLVVELTINNVQTLKK